MEFSQNETIRKLVQALDRAIRLNRAIGTAKFLPLYDSDVDFAHAIYLTYRCERSLFELLLREDKFQDVTWDDFRWVLQHSEELLDDCRRVLCHAVLRFPAQKFCFDLTGEVSPLEDICGDDGSDHLQVIVLLPFDLWDRVLACLKLRAEIAHFRAFFSGPANQITWDQYIERLAEDQELRDCVDRAYKDALSRLDFAGEWMKQMEEEGASCP